MTEGYGMGKEIKIGLAVILVLLVVFGGVLYQRLNGPPADTSTTAAEPAKPAATPAAPNTMLDPLERQTVVAASASADGTRSPAAGLAQWTVPSGDRAAAPESATDAEIPSPPATYMPRDFASTNAAPSDPFRRQAAEESPAATDVASTDPSLPGGAGEATEPPMAAAEASSVPTFAQPNPLRSRSAGYPNAAPEASESPLRYGQATSSSVQVTAVPSSVQNTTVPQPAPSYEPAPRSGYQAAVPVGAYAAPVAAPGASEIGSAGSTAAPVAGPGKYMIQPNDSYWTISEQLYGTGAYFQALAEHNRKKFPDENRLRAGDEILAPAVAELEKSYPSLCPKPSHRDTMKRHFSVVSNSGRLGGRVYVVQEGDTLFDIARFELGKASRWAEIYDLNREALGSDFDHLTPGMQLALPQDRPSGTVTERPDSVYQR